MRKLILLALAASAGMTAVPASAQIWRLQPSVHRQIQADLNQLDRQIQRATQRRTVSAREATGLRRQANRVQRLYSRYSRNGLTRQEVAQLEVGINQVRERLRLERRDWDGRRG